MTILFQLVRHEMLYGDGLPLTLLGSGFTQGNIFGILSRSLLFGLSTPAAKARRILIVACIVGIGLMNITVGPASAVLLLPRLNVSFSQVDTTYFLVLGVPMPMRIFRELQTMANRYCFQGSNCVDPNLLASRWTR